MEESFPRKIIPVVITNAAICDRKLICLKKQFERELQKIDEEITRFRWEIKIMTQFKIF